MDGLIIAITGGMIITGLLIRIALLNARLEGHRDAQQLLANGNNDNNVGYGCLRVLAIIGFLTVCGLCFYIGLAASAWAR
jgi:hypothetical protein